MTEIATKYLDAQHKEVEALFAQAERATPKAKQQLFEQIADKLAVHATIEEKIFYPGVKAKQTKDDLFEAVEEHVEIKRVIADLMKLDGKNETFGPKLKVLKEIVEHHVKDEREELFPKVEKLMSKAELQELTLRLDAMNEKLASKPAPRRAVPKETRAAAPI